MDDDIIARLRVNAEGAPTKNGGHIWLSLSPSTSAEAADLIEAQQSEIERLRAVLSDIDALACNVGRPDEAVDYWVTGYANAMQKVNALLHPGQARRG